jgi:hypothetical protein
VRHGVNLSVLQNPFHTPTSEPVSGQLFFTVIEMPQWNVTRHQTKRLRERALEPDIMVSNMSVTPPDFRLPLNSSVPQCPLSNGDSNNIGVTRRL